MLLRSDISRINCTYLHPDQDVLLLCCFRAHQKRSLENMSKHIDHYTAIIGVCQANTHIHHHSNYLSLYDTKIDKARPCKVAVKV